MGAAKYGARVGAAAFLLGLSLGGPQTIAVAAADDTPTPSASASDHNPRTQGTASAGGRGTGVSRPRATAARTAEPSAARIPEAQRASTALVASAATQRARSGNRTSVVKPQASPQRTSAGDTPSATVIAPDTSAPQPVQADVSPAPTAAADVGIVAGGVRVAKAVTPASATDTGPLGQVQAFVEGIGLLVRRTFFNKPPTVAPLQTSSLVDGITTGTLGATDPEGDPLSFSVTGTPTNGSVTVASDGTYTYTAGSGFTGLDAFTVAVTDVGFHINLLDFFRPASTEAYTQVSEGPGVTFSFIYGEGSQFWSATARNALQQAAYALASYVVAPQPVNITYNVTAFSNAADYTLASAGSDLTSGGSGFFPTVVQRKIQTGVDVNGSTADGEIDWNFGPSWGYGSMRSNLPEPLIGFIGNLPVVGQFVQLLNTLFGTSNQYDFTSTAMHELLHTFGFLSYIDPDPQFASDTNWTTFDQFVVTSGDVPVVNRSTFRWDGTFSDLYFDGPNAVAVYGGLVPLYSPNPYEPGSSLSHLRDSSFIGANEQLMNSSVSAGPGVRRVSPLELGILRDLGYTISDTPIYLFVVGFGFIRRRRGSR